jgi:acyl-[acyl-carrier-protein] desaturase
MITSPTIPLVNLLDELEPAVRHGLDRHISATTEWFPHEYVPYEVGRNYVQEPWAESDSALSAVARTALEVNLLTEDNLPSYHLALWATFGADGAWGEWTRRWTAEEGRHAIVLRDFLTVTRGLNPVALERGRMDHVARGWSPGLNGGFGDVRDGLVYTALQELATRISHRNTGAYTEDPMVEALTARIATDENLHYVFYRELAKAAIELDPSGMVLAMQRQVVGFSMPGLELPDFRAKAVQMAKAGIYDLRIHHDQVLRPVLFTHWKLDELDGLSDEAQRAREEISVFLAALDQTAARYEEKRAAAESG